MLDLHPREWVQVRSEKASPPYPSLILKTQREVVGKQVQVSIRKDFVMGRTFPSGGKGQGSHPAVWEQGLACHFPSANILWCCLFHTRPFSGPCHKHVIEVEG